MNLFKTLKNMVKPEVKANSMLALTTGDTLNLFSNNNLKNNPDIEKCTKLIADAVSADGLQVQVQGEGGPELDQEATDRLKELYWSGSISEMVYKMTTDLLYHGYTFISILNLANQYLAVPSVNRVYIKSEEGKELYPLADPMPAEGAKVWGITKTVIGNYDEGTLQGSRFPLYKALEPIKPLINIINYALEAQVYEAMAYGRGGLVVKGKVASDQERDALKKTLTGPIRNLLFSGETNVEKLPQADLVQLGAEARKQVIAYFQIPPQLFGEQLTYENAMQAQRQFFTDTVQPLQVLIKEGLVGALNYFIPDLLEGGKSLGWDRTGNAVLKYVEEEQYKREVEAQVKLLGAGAITLNEARISLGKEPLSFKNMDEPVYRGIPVTQLNEGLEPDELEDLPTPSETT